MTVGDYLERLATASQTRRNEQVEECLAHFGVLGTRELTLEQVAEYWEIVRGK